MYALFIPNIMATHQNNLLLNCNRCRQLWCSISEARKYVFCVVTIFCNNRDTYLHLSISHSFFLTASWFIILSMQPTWIISKLGYKQKGTRR